MIVVMDEDAPPATISAVEAYLSRAGFEVQRLSGHHRTLLGVMGDVSEQDYAAVRELPGVSDAMRVNEPYRLASRRFSGRSTVVDGPWGSIGGERPWLALEPVGLSMAHLGDEPPPSAQLRYEVAAGRPFDAAVVRTRAYPETVGALTCLSLHPLAAPRYAVRFVERGPSWGANQWIDAAERELERGETVVLLEAGGEYPNGARTLEIAAIARAKQRTHLPIVVDAATIAQRARYVPAVSRAAIAAGADGVMLRTWVGPEAELPRVAATLSWAHAVELGEELRQIAAIVRRP